MSRNKKTHGRLRKIATIFFIVASGVAISLYFASDNIVFFIKPSELKLEHLGKNIRIGGLVSKGSIEKMRDRTIKFDITDDIATITIIYQGIVPTLFREGQGVVAEGVIGEMDGRFIAEKLLTKHDENYKPPQEYRPPQEVK